MIRILYRSADGDVQTYDTIDAINPALQDTQGVVWVDLVEEPRESCEHILRDIFNFHPLAVDDALEEAHVPKVDDWEDYVYLVLHAARAGTMPEDELETLELDCFLGPHYLVTYQEHALQVVKRLWHAVQQDTRPLRGRAPHLLYVLADTLAEDYMQTVETLDERIDAMEDRIFAHPTNALLSQMFTLKRTLLSLRRILSPQREVLNKLARGNYASVVIEEHEHIYFRDVYDHLVRLYDLTDSMRDLVSGALDTYLSVVNNRMNDVMKTLTVITTLFMPLSFLAGFFGMNFFQPSNPFPAWTGRLVFGLTLAAMAGGPVGMYYWMRKRAWL